MNPTDADVVDPGFGPPPETDAPVKSGPAVFPARQGETSQISGQASADDETRSPEEESQSQLPGDPRPVNEEQPPTKEQY